MKLKEALDEIMLVKENMLAAKRVYQAKVDEYQKLLEKHFGYQDGQQLDLSQLITLIYTVAKND